MPDFLEICCRFLGPYFFMVLMILRFSSSSTEIMRCILSKCSVAVTRLNKLQAKVGNRGVIETLEVLSWGTLGIWRYGIAHAPFTSGAPVRASLTYFIWKKNIVEEKLLKPGI